MSFLMRSSRRNEEAHDCEAEAHAEAVRDAITQGVATKADIARLEDKMATRTDVAKLETRIAELKVTLLLAIVGVGGVVVAAIALLP